VIVAVQYPALKLVLVGVEPGSVDSVKRGGNHEQRNAISLAVVDG